jgi:hypothetical protein
MKILCLFRFPWKDLEEIWVKSFPRGPRIEILDIFFYIIYIYKWVVTIITNQWLSGMLLQVTCLSLFQALSTCQAVYKFQSF